MSKIWFGGLRKQKISTEQLGFFLVDLGIMLRAGLSLEEAIEIKASQGGEKQQLNVARALVKAKINKENISEGLVQVASLPVSLAKFIDARGKEKLPQSLLRIGRLLSRIAKIRKKYDFSLLSYPIMVMATCLLLLTVQMIFVIPVFEDFFSNYGQNLPPLTQRVIDASRFFKSNVLVILGIIIFFPILLTILLTNVRFVRRLFFGLMLRIPVMGGYIRAVETMVFLEAVRFYREPEGIASQAIEVAADLAVFQFVRGELGDIQEKVSHGSLSLPSVNWSSLYGQHVNLLIGHLFQKPSMHRVLVNLISSHREEARQRSKQLKSVVDPLVIMFIGSLFGVVIAALYLPMFQMSSVIW